MPRIYPHIVRDHQRRRGYSTARDEIRQELGAWCELNIKDDGSSYNLYTDGLKIYTTIDSRLQEYAHEVAGFR